MTGISRSAFYSHFDGKYDLLTSGIPDTIIDIGNPGSDGIDLTPFFAHVDDMAAVMKPLVTQPVLGDIMADFHRSLAASWAEYLGLDDDNWVLPDILAGALLAVAKSYVLQRPRPEPAVVAKQVELHFAALLSAADETEVGQAAAPGMLRR